MSLGVLLAVSTFQVNTARIINGTGIIGRDIIVQDNAADAFLQLLYRVTAALAGHAQQASRLRISKASVLPGLFLVCHLHLGTAVQYKRRMVQDKQRSSSLVGVGYAAFGQSAL